MAYADYEYYCNTYKGTMQQPDFERLCLRASAYLDMVTFGRVLHAPNSLAGRIQNACCAVADAMLLNEHGGGIASETNGKVTVNYIAGISNAKTENQRLYEAAARYLLMAGLLSRSVNA